MTYYVTSYCNKPHRLSDGKPIRHECRILPPKALERERAGDMLGAIEILSHEKRQRTMARGVSK